MKQRSGYTAELVYKGLVDQSPETLRKVKASFIADLELSVEDVTRILSAPQAVIITADDQEDLLKPKQNLEKAGAIVEVRMTVGSSPLKSPSLGAASVVSSPPLSKPPRTPAAPPAAEEVKDYFSLREPQTFREMHQDDLPSADDSPLEIELDLEMETPAEPAPAEKTPPKPLQESAKAPPPAAEVEDGDEPLFAFDIPAPKPPSRSPNPDVSEDDAPLFDFITAAPAAEKPAAPPSTQDAELEELAELLGTDEEEATAIEEAVEEEVASGEDANSGLALTAPAHTAPPRRPCESTA